MPSEEGQMLLRKQLVPGLHFVMLVYEDVIIYGKLMETKRAFLFPDDEGDIPVPERYIARCFSRIAPQCETGYVDLHNVSGLLTNAQWRMARERGWPSRIVEFLVLVQGGRHWSHAIYYTTEEGTVVTTLPLLSSS